MPAIEYVVGAPAAAGVATRKTFFLSAIVTGHAQDADHSGPGSDRSVKSRLSEPPDLPVSDDPGLRFPRRQRISRRGETLTFAAGYTRLFRGRD